MWISSWTRTDASGTRASFTISPGSGGIRGGARTTYESDDAEDCMDHLLDDVLWDGKSFYDLEKALTYIEW